MSAGTSRPVTPEDILADGQDATTFDGTEVRKGSVAAFVANAEILESLEPTDPDYAEVEAQLRALTPTLQAAGVFGVFEPKAAALTALVHKVLGDDSFN